MWKCAIGSKNSTRALRTLILTSVMLCIFVIYLTQSNNFNSFIAKNQFSRNRTNLTTGVGVSKNTNRKRISENTLVLTSRHSKVIEDESNKRNSFQTLIGLKREHDGLDTFANAAKVKRNRFGDLEYINVTNRNETEIEAISNGTNKYSTGDSVSKEVPSTTVKLYSSEASKIKKTVKFFSRKSDLGGRVNWNKFHYTPFRQTSNQNKFTRLPYFQIFNKSAYDILNTDGFSFDPTFKNPCFKAEEGLSPMNDGKLHCLPYFYLIGVKKSGTTDLYARLRRHPEFCRSIFNKESQWFAKLRFGREAHLIENSQFQDIIKRGIDPRNVEFFVSLFDKASRCISLHSSKTNNGSLYYKRVTAEASPSNWHMHTNWERLPGNENLVEPRYTNFNYIKHITPSAKIIIQFRDPVTRLYSDFLHTTHGKYGLKGPEVFHKHVTELIKAYTNCFTQFSQRSCAYNNSLRQDLIEKGVQLAESFSAGFYAVFMRDMLAVFGEKQVLPILIDDYVTKMEETLKNAFSFLEMSTVNLQTMRRMMKQGVKNVSKKKGKVRPMFKETRNMLYDFYRPYNQEMAVLMNNTRYLFPKT